MVENELDELSVEIELILTKGLSKDLISWFSILEVGKYFSSALLQNYSVFISANNYI